MIQHTHKKKSNTSWIEIEDKQDTKRIRLLFTCRTGGYSSYPYDSLNMATHVEDDYNHVMKNRDKVLGFLNLHTDQSICAEQTHSDSIAIVSKDDFGKGSNLKQPISETDGLLTIEQDVALLSFYADCVPVYVWDITKGIIGIAHAGWKGTALDIAGKLIEKFCVHYQSIKENIKVAIGPSICKKCFEVDETVMKTFQEVFTEREMDLLSDSKGNEKYILDLRMANEMLVLKRDILPTNILHMNQCTYCNPELFFSHRFTKGKTGRMAAIIMQEKVR